jgi:hypothetical protein
MEIRKLMNTFTGIWSSVQRLAGIIPIYFQNSFSQSPKYPHRKHFRSGATSKGQGKYFEIYIFLETHNKNTECFFIDSHT